ncbi:MAG: LysM peptidoglycan-binding domain-containing protein [Methylococcales bacterium]|nr:LysM peptidoglycan-binding domain-containing protein [Methylococcales bacterium]
MTINLKAIPKIWRPKASRYMTLLVNAFKNTGVTNPLVLAYACASITHESSWNIKIENTHDSAAGTPWSGKGLAQVTLESNYQKITDLTGIDFMNHPEYMFIAYYSLRAKAAHFVIHGMVPLIEAGQFEAAAGIYNAGKPDYRSNYTKNVANSTLQWIRVFSSEKNINHSTSYGYTKPKTTPHKPKSSYKSSTRSNPLPSYNKSARRNTATTTRRYGELPRLNMPAPRYSAAPKYKAGTPYIPARYIYAKPQRGKAPVLNQSPRYTPSSSKSYTKKANRSSSKSYFIKKGDSLYSIASRVGISFRTLLSMNKQITDASNIRVGDMIKVPR